MRIDRLWSQSGWEEKITLSTANRIIQDLFHGDPEEGQPNFNPGKQERECPIANLCKSLRFDGVQPFSK